MKPDWLNSKPPEERSPFWWLRWVPTVIVSGIVLYFLYVAGSVAIVPVLASFALAYLLNPVVYEAEKRGLSRVMSSIVAILLVTLVISAFLAYVVPDLWAQSTKAGSRIAENFTPENAARQRAYLKRYSPPLEAVAGDKIEQFLSDPSKFYNENITTGATAIVDEEGKLTTTAGGGGGSVIFTAIVSSLDLLLVPFFVFYILIDFQKWRDSLEALIPPRFREPFTRLFDESGRILESYVRGQLLIGLIMAVFYAIGFWFLGVPAWAGIALLAGLLNAVPYVGTVLVIVLAGGFTVAGGGSVWDAAAVLGVFVGVQTLEGYYLTPKILGERPNLHPMAVFLGLLIGGKLFGLLGVILAIPAIAIGKVPTNLCASFTWPRISITRATCTRRISQAKISKNASPTPPKPYSPNKSARILKGRILNRMSGRRAWTVPFELWDRRGRKRLVFQTLMVRFLPATI